jgi:3-keto-5-aminohexanoate cleavage enzyme
MSSKFILNFAPTGMIPTKQMTPHVPVTPDEITMQVLEAAELGANMVHLHVRDPETGNPTYKKEYYADIIREVRHNFPSLVVCATTSGRTFSEFQKRSEVLDLDGDCKPDFGSLTLSSLNFNQQVSVNSPQMIQALAQKMLDRGIRPEMEVFDLGMINYAHYLIRKGLIKPPYYFNLILGNIACAQATLLNLGLMIKELPQGAVWSAAGVGDSQLTMNIMALISGGGVRVGLEDNIWYDAERTRMATNRDLIQRILGVANAMGFEPYSQEEVREMLIPSS